MKELGEKVAIGENVRCYAEVRAFVTKALTNAAAITLEIINPAGTVVETKTMVDITHESLGVYYYSYKPAVGSATGTYTAFWDVTVAGEHRKPRGYFIVTE
jgi:uncharacterized protein YfaS (alpha-2-macroglobulin family)